MKSTVATMAQGLSDAQRIWLRDMWALPSNALYGERLHRYQPERNRLASAVALSKRGLVERNAENNGPDAWECDRGRMGFVRLTDLGVLVRGELRAARSSA